MKNENGITLIKLCISIFILIAIICICIYSWQSSYKSTKLEKFVIEMELIQEKVNFVRNEYKNWEGYNSTEPSNFHLYLQNLGFSNADSSSNIYSKEFNQIISTLNNENTKYWDINTDSILANYCYFTPEDLENFLGIKDTNLYVIINFYTGNIISKEPVEDTKTGEKIYRQYDTDIGSKLVSTRINSNIVPQVQVVENYGLSQKIKIYFETENMEEMPNILEIYYLNNSKDEIKKKCSDLKDYEYISSEKAAYFTINTSGEYSFVVEDTNYIEYPEVKKEINLCNSPILAEGMKGIYWDDTGNEISVDNYADPNWYNYSSEFLRMANAKDFDGNYWVWIPRYTYKENAEESSYEFVAENTITSTKNKATNGYKIHEAFLENGDIKGFWISKFQSNGEMGNKVSIKSGQTLTILSKRNAQNNCVNNVNEYIKRFSKLMSDNQREAVLYLSKSENINISNDLIHYAGGSPNEDEYKKNVQYSSSGNIYGVYDLIASENELTLNSDINSEGRYRPVLVIK